MRRALALILCVLTLMFQVGASAPARVAFIWPVHILQAGQSSQWTIRVEPMPEHRALVLTAVAEDGPVRESRIQIDGDTAPAIHIIRWGSLPSGDLTVIAAVLTQDAEAGRASVQIQVLERF